MKNTDREKQIDSIMFRVESCYAGDFDPNSFDIWHDVLSRYAVDDISAAFTTHVKKSKFLPTISEIVAIIEERQVPRICIEAEAEQQWRLVLSTLGRGKYDDPVTAHLCKRQFNNNYLRNMLEKNENWEQKRFCKAYELAAELHKNNLQIENVHPDILKLAEGIG